MSVLTPGLLGEMQPVPAYNIIRYAGIQRSISAVQYINQINTCGLIQVNRLPCEIKQQSKQFVGSGTR